MEIGRLDPGEWSWVMAHSAETAWSQLSPAQQATTPISAVAPQAYGMLRQSLSAPGSALLVAREQGQPVGYILVTIMPDDLTMAPTGLFADIWVDPAWRGHGLASRLTAAGEDHCRALGLKRVNRMVAASNIASLKHAMSDGCQIERYLLTKQL